MTTRVIKTKPDLFERVTAILEEARNQVVRTINTRMVVAYWLIGQEIVNAEQGGKPRAGYGETLLKDLSARLTERFGKGYSTGNLRNFRQFHLCFIDRLPQIGHALRSQFILNPVPTKKAAAKIHQTLSIKLPSKKPANINNKEIHYTANAGLQPVGEQGFEPELSWSHYCLLMRVENKDPYVLEFPDLPEGHELVENKFSPAVTARPCPVKKNSPASCAAIGKSSYVNSNLFMEFLVLYDYRMSQYELYCYAN